MKTSASTDMQSMTRPRRGVTKSGRGSAVVFSRSLRVGSAQYPDRATTLALLQQLVASSSARPQA